MSVLTAAVTADSAALNNSVHYLWFRRSEVWPSAAQLGPLKAEVEVSSGLDSYLDALGKVPLQDRSGRWQNPVPRWTSAEGLSQLLKATHIPHCCVLRLPVAKGGQVPFMLQISLLSIT